MDTPLYSVLMPPYEPHPQQLAEALDSLLAQTEPRWSLLIHDDASKKNVKSMIAHYLEDPRITFARSEKNLGIGGNWNACFFQAEAGIRDWSVTGVQTCALPISSAKAASANYPFCTIDPNKGIVAVPDQ